MKPFLTRLPRSTDRITYERYVENHLFTRWDTDNPDEVLYTINRLPVSRDKFIRELRECFRVEIRRTSDMRNTFEAEFRRGRWCVAEYQGLTDNLVRLYYRDDSGVSITSMDHALLMCNFIVTTLEQK